MGNINANPLAVQLLRRHHRRAAAAERVEDNIPFIGTGLDNALKQSEGFLSFITKLVQLALLVILISSIYSVLAFLAYSSK